MKILLTIGDSWPMGAELNEGANPYGYWLTQKLGCDKWINLASPGASNEHSLFNLEKYLQSHSEQDTVIAVFFLTNPARCMYKKQDFLYTADSEQQQQMLHFHSYDWFRNSVNVMAMQSLCQQHGIDDYYFAGWVKYLHWFHGVNLDKVWQKGKETAADWFGASDHNGEHIVNANTNPFIMPNFAHPNEKGHQLIADQLFHWIIKVSGEKYVLQRSSS